MRALGTQILPAELFPRCSGRNPSTRLGDRIAELARGIDPQVDGILRIGGGFGGSHAVSHASGQVRHLGDEVTIVVAPDDEKLILVRAYRANSSASFRTT